MSSNHQDEFTFLDLLEFLTKSEVTESWAIEYKGDREYKLKETKIHPGRMTFLSQTGLSVVTGLTWESQTNLFKNCKRVNSKGTPAPPVLNPSNWINLAALLDILRKEGFSIRNPKTGSLVEFEDLTLPNGKKYPVWKQLRDWYEEDVLGSPEDHYSEYIKAYYESEREMQEWEAERSVSTVGKPPKASDKPKRGVKPLTPLNAHEGDNLLSDPRWAAIVESLPADKVSLLLEMIPTKKLHSRLASLINGYMQAQRIDSTRALAVHLLAQYGTPEPEKYPQLEAMTSLLDRLQQGEAIDQSDPAYLPTVPALADALVKEDGSPFAGVKDLLVYCAGG